VALAQPTPGQTNATPEVGPVVISEVMYHPPELADAEYVELLNISDQPVALYDVIQGRPWRFTDDPDNPQVDLLLPADDPVTLAPGVCLILAKNPVAFAMVYTAPANVQVIEWGGGRLSDTGEKLQLSQPGSPNGDGDPQWIRIDRLVYSDGAAPSNLDPWPAEADGAGLSLTRIDPTAYGNDPANWQAAAPTPGRAD
jgi:hypothetical protein